MARAPADLGPPPPHRNSSLVPSWLTGWRPGWLGAGFFILISLALGMRLWELSGRGMHYDEAIHVHFAWKLLHSDGAAGGFPWIFGQDFIHSPWMHGPFQIELTAFIFRLFGDSDFTARLGYVLFGAALVALPYFLRDYLGRAGALLAGVMLALSPAMLYFSRFGRNDIIMAFWATALFVLMWRYMQDGKHRWLFLVAVVLAFMFGTKETAYIVTIIFASMAFFLALPQLVPWVLGRGNLSGMAGPAGFFLLLLTLTLPQWVPLVSLLLDPLGLTLANADGVVGGLVGAPQWAGSGVGLPIYDAPWPLHGFAALLLVGLLGLLARRVGYSANSVSVYVGIPLAAVAAVAIAAFQPIDGLWAIGGAPILDFALAGALAGSAVGCLLATGHPWRTGIFLLIIPAQLTFFYCFFLTGLVNLQSMVDGLLPGGISVDASTNAVPVNYLVAGGLLLAGLNLSIYLGVRWLGGRWLAIAGLFYFLWAAVYTTLFTNVAGVFSGVWQGMGYWIAQQDVARGDQPWYYYFVGLSIYEMLPVIFGIAGAVYFFRKGDIMGLALAFWAVATLVAYTLASEKMPWLLVNITLPIILLSGKFLGELVERVRWRRALARGHVIILVLPAFAVAAAVYLFYVYTDPAGDFSSGQWGLLLSTVLVALAAAYALRLAGPSHGSSLATLSLAALLLGFGTVGAVRAAYTFDDSNQEFLVYAQGSKDVRVSFQELDSRILSQLPPGEIAGPEAFMPEVIRVDYDMWYPFQWYARDANRSGALTFGCFKAEGEEGWNASCNPINAENKSQGMLLASNHAIGDPEVLADYELSEASRNLLWFYELAYRRPGENRTSEGSLGIFKGLPNKEQISKDFDYFKSVATSKKSWFGVLDYLIFRNLKADWYTSEYYSYLPP